MKFSITLLFLMLTAIAFSQTGEVVTNQTIIQLQKAGLGKDVLKSKIQTSTCNFDLSTDGLITLKNAQVPDEVINMMLSKTPAVAVETNKSISLGSGIYYFDTPTNQYIALDPSILTNQKSGGLGESLRRSVTGLFNSKLRASLSGKTANAKFTTTKPVFLFVFDTITSGFSNSSSYWGAAQSPNEFFLVKLTVDKKSREVVVGKENNIKSNVGIDDDVKVQFTSKKIRRGVYEITSATGLKEGEYCFMFAASSMSAGQSHKVYDFSITD